MKESIEQAIYHCKQADECLEKEQFKEAKNHLETARQIILQASPIDQTSTTAPAKGSSVFIKAVTQRQTRLKNLLTRIEALESRVDRLKQGSEEHRQSCLIL